MKTYQTVSIEIVLYESEDVIMNSNKFMQDDIFGSNNQGPTTGGFQS